jgi:thiol-disulfide isomerase/thioredoxin
MDFLTQIKSFIPTNFLPKSMPMLGGQAVSGLGGAPTSFMSEYGMYIGIILFVLALAVGSYLYINHLNAASNETYSIGQENGEGGGKEAELMLFYVDWCPHCKTAKPEWDELKAQYQNSTINGYKVTFTEVNCTEETAEVESMINKYKIEGYPTVKLIKDGQIIEYDAKPTKDTMSEFLNTVL